MADERMTCATCDGFMSPKALGSIGMCRMHPPAPLVIGMQAMALGRPFDAGKMPIVQGFFPPVGADCWCCEWRPKWQRTSQTMNDEVIDAGSDKPAETNDGAA